MRKPTLVLLACVLLVIIPSSAAWAWGKGHRLIRTWAVAKLPSWQREKIGAELLQRLCVDYSSLQDRHAGGAAPELDPYCVMPGVRLSLHDVNPAGPSAEGKQWLVRQVIERIRADETDEAMKFLGVLCHWNEDPGCPSAHSSPVTEWQLRQLIPPPPDKERFNYLYGYGGIADVGNYVIKDEAYQPRLLGATVEEAALRMYQRQRLLERSAAARIVPLVQDMMHGDGAKADEQRAAAALENARHVADVIYTILCLAFDRLDPSESQALSQQPLTDWLSDFRGGRTGHPYYVLPFLVNQSLDAERNLHPLALPGEGDEARVAFGLGMGAPFSLDYTLAPGGVFDRFTCRVGLHPTAGPQGEVTFAVAVNDRVLAQTEPIRSGAPPVELDVPLPDAPIVNLSLRTIPTDPAASKQNLAVWAEPLLIRAKE